MKKIVLFCCLVLASMVAQAQGYMRGRFLMEGDYTRTSGFEPSAVLALDFRNRHEFCSSPNYSEFAFTFGYKAGPDKHFFNVAYQIGINTSWRNEGLLYIENRYLYRRFKAFGIQEFTGMFCLGYRNIHWNFKLGLCNRYMAAIPLRHDGGMGTIFEPMNVVFDLEYYLFPNAPVKNPTSRFDEMHSWNIGCGISNCREFIVERVTLFYYTLNGYYDINDKWRVLGEAGLHPAGVLNLSSQYNGFFFNVGFTYNHE